jgi:O-antigen ligase
MSKSLKNQADLLGDPMNWLAALVFFTPAFFLILKSVATTSLFLAFFICSWSIIKTPRYYFAARGRQFWILILCLLAPFFAELLAQAGRGSFIGPSLDGPSRAILAAGIFVYLSKRDCTKLLSALSIGSAVGIALVFLSLQVSPEYFWGDRFATYFVDPITLPCFTIGLLGIFLFTGLPGASARFNGLAKAVLALLTLYVAIGSYSRSSWVAGMALAEVYLLYTCRHSKRNLVIGHVCVLFCIFALFQFSEVFRARTLEVISSLFLFFNSGQGQLSSTVQRVILTLIDLEIIRNNPFFGLADGVMPTYESLKTVIPSINLEIYEIKRLAGSHSELLAQLVRKGVFLGGFVIWGLFLYPIIISIRELKARNYSCGGLRTGLLGLVVPVMFSGLTIQVFNLKMTMSFYMLALAIFFAYHCSRANVGDHEAEN